MVICVLLQPLCLCMAMVSGAAYASNILSQEVVDRVVAKLYQDHCRHTQVATEWWSDSTVGTLR